MGHPFVSIFLLPHGLPRLSLSVCMYNAAYCIFFFGERVVCGERSWRVRPSKLEMITSRSCETSFLGATASKKKGGWVGERLLASASAPQERWGALDRASKSLGRTSERHRA